MVRPLLGVSLLGVMALGGATLISNEYASFISSEPHTSQWVAQHVQRQECAPSSLADAEAVSGFSLKVPGLASAERLTFSTPHAVTYAMKAAPEAVASFYRQTLAARCWKQEEGNGLVFSKGNKVLSLNLNYNPLSQKTFITYTRGHGVVAGVSTESVVWAAQDPGMPPPPTGDSGSMPPPPSGSGTFMPPPPGDSSMMPPPGGTGTYMPPPGGTGTFMPPSGDSGQYGGYPSGQTSMGSPYAPTGPYPSGQYPQGMQGSYPSSGQYPPQGGQFGPGAQGQFGAGQPGQFGQGPQGFGQGQSQFGQQQGFPPGGPGGFGPGSQGGFGPGGPGSFGPGQQGGFGPGGPGGFGQQGQQGFGPGSQGGFGQGRPEFGGGFGEGEAGSEDEFMQRIDEERFKQMKAQMVGTEKMVKGITTRMQQVEKKLCVPLPPEVKNALTEAQTIVQEIKGAADADALEGVAMSMGDVFATLEEAGSAIPQYFNTCAQQKRIGKDVAALEKKFKSLKTKAAKNTDLNTLVAQVEGEINAAKTLVQEGGAVIKDDIDAAAEKYGEVYARFDDITADLQTVEIALDITKNAKKFDADVKKYNAAITRLTKQKKDPTALKELVTQYQQAAQEVKDALKNKASGEELVGLMEEISPLKREIENQLTGLTGTNAYAPTFKSTEKEFQFKVDDAFKFGGQGGFGGGAQGFGQQGFGGPQGGFGGPQPQGGLPSQGGFGQPQGGTTQGGF